MEFDSWYEASYKTVLAAVIVASLGNRFEAEDATNDAFVKAFECWNRVSAMESPTGWVVRVAINSSRKRFRRSRRDLEALRCCNTSNCSEDSVFDRGSELWAAVERLPTRQREAIVLRYVKGQSQKEIALAMGIAIGTASATLTQARASLREEISSD